MKLSFQITITELNVHNQHIAANTLQIEKIYSVSNYAPCWEWESISGLKTAKSTIHYSWWT